MSKGDGIGFGGIIAIVLILAAIGGATYYFIVKPGIERGWFVDKSAVISQNNALQQQNEKLNATAEQAKAALAQEQANAQGIPGGPLFLSALLLLLAVLLYIAASSDLGGVISMEEGFERAKEFAEKRLEIYSNHKRHNAPWTYIEEHVQQVSAQIVKGSADSRMYYYGFSIHVAEGTLKPMRHNTFVISMLNTDPDNTISNHWDQTVYSAMDDSRLGKAKLQQTEKPSDFADLAQQVKDLGAVARNVNEIGNAGGEE